MTFDFNQVIPTDFDVELLYKTDDGSLFGAKRKDVWHFVKTTINVENSDENYTDISISQQHIPRYMMADAIKSLIDFNELTRHSDHLEMAIATPESDPIAVYSRGKNIYDLSFFPTENGLPKDFIQQVEEDIAILELAKSKVEYVNGEYVLPNAKSHTGLPVAAEFRRLIEAIAFEKECRKKLDPRKFGIYSAFCTWKDFTEGKEFDKDIVEEAVVGQLEYDADAYDYGDFMPVAMAVQERLFENPIWGAGIAIDANEAVEIVYEGIQDLTSIQWAQWQLMNGMHEGGLFLPLAQVLGLNSWEQYMRWKTDDFQPDSFEEQAVRTETMFIKMLGDLGDE